MLEALKTYIKSVGLFKGGKKLLLAVSGGVDSVVLVHLIAELNLTFEIAHCNFCLRKKDADEDQLFVENLAKQFGVRSHVNSFNTEQYARANKISIQMAARDLRFSWFNQLISEKDFSCVVLGTHVNDAIETFILNATKGTGIAGLRGILPKNDTIVRPLLFATKLQIETYAKENDIEFREDKSNESTKYLRNKIRHQIIPVLQEINPSLESTFIQNFSNLNFAERIYLEKIEAVKKSTITIEDGVTIVNIKRLKQNTDSIYYLYELLKPYGFTFSDCENIIQTNTSGKQFFAGKHLLLVNRDQLLVKEVKNINRSIALIKEDTVNISTPVCLHFSHIKTPNNLKLPPEIALLDIAKISFPLEVRPWQYGDSFYPLGMSQKKKLSDFLIDKKISLVDKENVCVLTSNDKIVWVIGHRIDNRYKVSEPTSHVLKISMKKFP
jgi:tRNA(Ile)-lysidine synthase